MVDIIKGLRLRKCIMLKMIHDLDNMLYPEYPGAVDDMNMAGALAAVHDCHMKISVAEAKSLIEKAVKECPGWLDLLVQRGLDVEKFMGPYHERLDHLLIQPYPQLTEQFNSLAGQADHVVLTHSNGEWAHRTIKHIGLHQHLPEARVLSWEKYKAWKSVSTTGFEKAAALLQAEPREIIFSDDSVRNLKTAKDMGMTTVWVSHGRNVPAGAAAHIDHCVENITVFLEERIEALKGALPVALKVPAPK